MPAQIKIIAIYIIIVANGILFCVLMFNPKAKDWWSLYEYHQKPAIMQPWVFNLSFKLNLNEQVWMYRGDRQRLGYFTNILNPTIKKIKFISKDYINMGIHGASKSSPVVSDKYIITVSDFGLLSVYSNIDKELQEPLWTFTAYSAERGFHSTPLLVGDQLFFGDYRGTFYSLDLNKKQFNWITPLGDAVGASPIIDSKGNIYVSVEIRKPDGYITKIDPNNGKIIWVSEYLGEQGHSSPTLSEDESILMFGDNLGSFTALDTQTGEQIWKKVNMGPIKSTPTVFKDMVYFTSWDASIYAVEITTGKIKWVTHDVGKFNQSSIAISPKDEILVVHSKRNGICTYFLKNGKEKNCYKVDLKNASVKSSSIITESSKWGRIVWAPCGYDDLCVLRLDNMSLIKKWNVKEGISGEPVVYKQDIFVITEGEGGLIKL